jgi:hypothetical protein
MPKRAIRRLLIACTALSSAAALSSGVVNTASASTIKSSVPTPTISVTTKGRPIPGLTFRITTSGPTRTFTNTAGDPCENGLTERVWWSEFGITEGWSAMTTNFCYDNVTVTSHYTYMTWWAGVLSDVSQDPIQFNCYVANGSSRNCSGNNEQENTTFFWPSEIYVTIYIREWENYHGAWGWNYTVTYI